jgi:sigma-54-interacting transcriptional regulator
MAQSFRLPSTADPLFAQSPVGEEGLARFTKLNLLVMGDDEDVARFVTSLWPYFLTPCVVRHRGERLRLLSTSSPAGTILIHDVNTLTGREQGALHRWMDAGNNRTRIVSTTSQSLLPALETGGFDDELYYRLNVLTFDLRPPVAQ